MAIYVNNKALLEQLRLSNERKEPTSELIEMFILMADKFGYKLQYKNPMDREDCAAFAVMDCYLYWDRFNINKGTNAFSYFTQMIKMGYAKGWRKLHPQPMANFIGLTNIWSI